MLSRRGLFGGLLVALLPWKRARADPDKAIARLNERYKEMAKAAEKGFKTANECREDGVLISVEVNQPQAESFEKVFGAKWWVKYIRGQGIEVRDNTFEIPYPDGRKMSGKRYDHLIVPRGIPALRGTVGDDVDGFYLGGARVRNATMHYLEDGSFVWVAWTSRQECERVSRFWREE